MDLQAAYDAQVSSGSWQPDPDQASVIPLLQRLGDEVQKPAKKRFWFGARAQPLRGLYLWGGVGRGKSMLMDLFVAQMDGGVRRIHFHAFMQEVHERLHQVRREGIEDALAPVAAAISADLRVLALDEMQITDITDAMVVGRLFDLLFGAGIAIVTTSNRPPDDLYKDGLNRQLFLPFIALLKERMEVHEIGAGLDYRQNRLVGSPVYFCPADHHAANAISQIWKDLSGAEDKPAFTLRVKGRTVTLPGFRNGVGRATFHDLCGQPLGAADYLALAQSCKVLIVENIPHLGRENFNEAKRFVLLVDALYEARVRLIVSAAAPPEKIYVEGEGSFEFERTASRLREMQSSDWCAV